MVPMREEYASRHLAAYVLGYNSYAFRIEESVWGPLRQNPGQTRRFNPSCAQAVVRRADSAGGGHSSACLYGNQDVSGRLHRGLVGGVGLFGEGKPFETKLPRDDGKHGREARDQLCVLVEEALQPDHLLNPLVWFGLALGEYECAEYLGPKSPGWAEDDFLPDINKLVQRAKALPPGVLRSLVEVKRLTDFGPKLGRLGAVEFVKRVLDPVPSWVRDFVPWLAVVDAYAVLNDRVRMRLGERHPTARDPAPRTNMIVRNRSGARQANCRSAMKLFAR